jgi:hypothetical protein
VGIGFARGIWRWLVPAMGAVAVEPAGRYPWHHHIHIPNEIVLNGEPAGATNWVSHIIQYNPSDPSW